MRRTLAIALVFALSLAAASAAEKSEPARKKPAPPARCEKVYRRAFTVTRFDSKVQLRVLKLTSEPPGAAVLEVPFQMCKRLGPGWRVAVGSYGAAFLDEMKASDSAELKAALAACPVTFRRIDTTCAPCVAGSQHCPCANRDISDWIFCEKP